MNALLVRAATASDLDACQRIYAHHVLHGTGTFEEDPPDLAEITRRHTRVCGLQLPWLVAVDEVNAVRGFAYAAPFRERSAYRFTVEDSVYIAPDARGQGVGKRLLRAVIDDVTASGKQRVLAVIGDSDNAASIALHTSCGFTRAGVLTGVGVKFGRVLDVVLMERALTPILGDAR